MEGFWHERGWVAIGDNRYHEARFQCADAFKGAVALLLGNLAIGPLPPQHLAHREVKEGNDRITGQ